LCENLISFSCMGVLRFISSLAAFYFSAFFAFSRASRCLRLKL
jgi:hypothetical protein